LYISFPGFVTIFALLRGKNHAGTSRCTAGQNLFYSKNLQGFRNLEGLGDLNCQKFFSPYFFALLPDNRFCHDFCFAARQKSRQNLRFTLIYQGFTPLAMIFRAAGTHYPTQEKTSNKV